MDPKFQTSFIPKTSVATPSSHQSVSTFGSISFLPSLGTILFVLAIVLSLGLFGYEHLLNTEITGSMNSLNLAKSEFDPNTLQTLVTASSQISSAKTLLSRHIMVSNLFAYLQANVLPQVTFSSFKFDYGTTGQMEVIMSGQAASYSVLAEQSAIFSKLPYMTNPAFSNFNLTDTGTVSMDFQANIDPSIVSYQKYVDAANQAAPLQAQSVTAISSPLVGKAVATTTSASATSTAQ